MNSTWAHQNLLQTVRLFRLLFGGPHLPLLLIDEMGHACGGNTKRRADPKLRECNGQRKEGGNDCNEWTRDQCAQTGSSAERVAYQKPRHAEICAWPLWPTAPFNSNCDGKQATPFWYWSVLGRSRQFRAKCERKITFWDCGLVCKLADIYNERNNRNRTYESKARCYDTTIVGRRWIV